jgi:hypothetical protein
LFNVELAPVTVTAPSEPAALPMEIPFVPPDIAVAPALTTSVPDPEFPT